MLRRTCLSLLGSSIAMFAAPAWPETLRRKIARYLETHRRSEGGYGWEGDVTAQVTPTFGAVGSYLALGLPVPGVARAAAFVRENYPVAERRRTERPLWRLDFEQVQTLLWLGESLESFRALAEQWKKPADFTTNYELGGNPVFQHQAMAVRVRHLMKLSPAGGDAAWREYFSARRRANGTFNNTPASDGSQGHLLNTLWGTLAADCLGMDASVSPELVEWVTRCQLPSGGFTYAPKADPGGVDDVAYTWAAVQLLARAKAQSAISARCTEWIESLLTAEGGFQDRPGGEPNPLATYYALDCFRILGHSPRETTAPAIRAKRYPVENGMQVFSAQVQGPGNGSPREAVLLAESLGIHLWTAKNSPKGWVEEARRVATAKRAAVQFHIGDEEYGTYVALPGLGCYSHLVDTLAPFGRDSGKQLRERKFPYPWAQFRDTRIASLRRGGGRLVWQFNENEELTRILLDEAVEKGTYSAIASFHFGNENFLHSQPFLHRWDGRLAFVGLQDAHGTESWWWSKYLTAFRTLFVAREPTWEAWLEALDKNHVIAVRHDAVTGWKTHVAGGNQELRDFIFKREHEWNWWGNRAKRNRAPLASLVALTPGMVFEAGAPREGVTLRLRLAADTTNQGVPKEDLADLVELRVDGKKTEFPRVESEKDRYHLLRLDPTPGTHTADAIVRERSTGWVETISAFFELNG